MHAVSVGFFFCNHQTLTQATGSVTCLNYLLMHAYEPVPKVCSLYTWSFELYSSKYQQLALKWNKYQ